MAKERRKGEITQGIPTDDWNEFCRVSKQVAQLIRAQEQFGKTSGASNLTCEVFNATEGDIDSDYPVLKLSAPTFTPEDRESVVHDGIFFEGRTPDADTKVADIAIVQSPLANTRSGYAIFEGYSWCMIDVTDEAHTNAKPIEHDNTKLKSATSGAPITWKPSGTGVLKALIKLGGAPRSTQNFTQFALVIESAGKNGSSVGSCVLLTDTMEVQDADGNPLITDPLDPDYDEDLVNAVAVQFKCAQVWAACVANARVWLSSNDDIEPGSAFTDHAVWGVCVDTADYVWGLPSAAEKTSLAIKEGGTDASDVDMLGGEC